MPPRAPLIAAGLDLGGTKIEAQVFDGNWSVVDTRRVATPDNYIDLIAALTALIEWCGDVPVGIGSAGLVDPATGLVFAANLCAHGHPLPDDINTATGRMIPYINDGRAIALSEATFGAGQGLKTTLTVILGTGVGGGITHDGTLRAGPSGLAGEIGHTSAPAALISHYNLPLLTCGCGRIGCIETYVSGPGMERIATTLTGNAMPPREVAATRQAEGAPVWEAWRALTADLLRNLILSVDPDVIVLGGGLSKIEGVTADLGHALRAAQIGDFPIPQIVLAQGGDTSGARGAAFAAWSAQ